MSVCTTVFAGLLLVAATVQAQVKPETAIRYRQSLFHVIQWNLVPLAEMTKGKAPFDAAEAEKRAARIAALAEQIVEGFPAGSDSGADTDAKSEIWLNLPDFEAKAHALATQAGVLGATAKGGNETEFRAQFDRVRSACKACHDKFRSD